MEMFSLFRHLQVNNAVMFIEMCFEGYPQINIEFSHNPH